MKKRETKKEKIERLRKELMKAISGSSKGAHDSLLVNGECRYPGCRCNKRPVFSRHRFKAAI